jgi:integrase
VETGCRAGELAGLRVRNLAPGQRRLRVEEAVQEVGGQLVSGPPKTAAGRRTVDNINADLCLRLAGFTAGMAPNDYVFGEGATPLRHNNFSNRVWVPTVNGIGLPGARFHDLRHYHASAMLLLVGEGRVGEVARRLGHAKPSVTLDVYGHVLDHQGRDVSQAFADLRAAAAEQAANPAAGAARPAASGPAGQVTDLAAYRARHTG